jgi:hypothetical protein
MPLGNVIKSLINILVSNIHMNKQPPAAYAYPADTKMGKIGKGAAAAGRGVSTFMGFFVILLIAAVVIAIAYSSKKVEQIPVTASNAVDKSVTHASKELQKSMAVIIPSLNKMATSTEALANAIKLLAKASPPKQLMDDMHKLMTVILPQLINSLPVAANAFGKGLSSKIAVPINNFMGKINGKLQSLESTIQQYKDTCKGKSETKDCKKLYEKAMGYIKDITGFTSSIDSIIANAKGAAGRVVSTFKDLEHKSQTLVTAFTPIKKLYPAITKMVAKIKELTKVVDVLINADPPKNLETAIKGLMNTQLTGLIDTLKENAKNMVKIDAKNIAGITTHIVTLNKYLSALQSSIEGYNKLNCHGAKPTSCVDPYKELNANIGYIDTTVISLQSDLKKLSSAAKGGSSGNDLTCVIKTPAAWNTRGIELNNYTGTTADLKGLYNTCGDKDSCPAEWNEWHLLDNPAPTPKPTFECRSTGKWKVHYNDTSNQVSKEFAGYENYIPQPLVDVYDWIAGRPDINSRSTTSLLPGLFI